MRDAAAGRRVHETSGLVSENRTELDLAGTTIRSTDAASADLSLYGALAQPPPGRDNRFAIGDGNELRARIRGANGSGPRANIFSRVTGPVLPSKRGNRNRLVVYGDEREFVRLNPGIEPVPPCRCWEPDATP